MIDETQLAAYHAAREAAAFADLSDWGWLRLTGRDRLDLLHRLSTNALKHLRPGEGAPTVLTNAMGRVIAFLTVYAGEDDVLVRCMPGQAAGVTRYLTSMIFWQDQVEIVDLTPAVSQFTLYGPQAESVLQSLSAEDTRGIPPYGKRSAMLAGAHASLHRGGPLESHAFLLDLAPSDRRPVFNALAAGLPRLSAETVDLLRIEAGLPLWGRELTDQVTPLETGLLAAISFNKGCYTGQEVIARQTNYDKVTRNLVGIEFAQQETDALLAELIPAFEGPWAAVSGPGRGGFVGSVAFSPALNQVIGLAVIPRELVQPRRELELVRNDRMLKATVRGLPFITRNF